MKPRVKGPRFRKSRKLGNLHGTAKKFTEIYKARVTLVYHSGPVRSTLGKYENGSITLKTHQMFCHRFRKIPFSNCFPSPRKHKNGVSKFLQVEERFQKALFSWWISVDGRPNRRNKAGFSISHSVVWTLPHL